MWLCLLSLALAGPEDGLDAATRPFWERAVDEEEHGRPARAAAFYRLVLSGHPDFVPASLGLGRALEASGDAAGAEQIYRELGAEADAVEALARLIEARDPDEALGLWRQLETLRLGDSAPLREQARLLLPRDPVAALAAWEAHVARLEGAEPDGATLVALGAALIEAGHVTEGEALWRRYMTSFPTGTVSLEIAGRLDLLDVEREAQALALGGSEPLSDALLRRWAEGRAALVAGRLAEAEEIARAVVAGGPRSADAHGLLADVFIARGSLGDAETEAILARALAPEDADAHVRLGLMLVDAYGGRRNQEAAEELRKAAVLRSGEGRIHYRLGLVEQSLGNWEAALDAYDAFLAGSPDGPEAEDAAARVLALRRETPAAPDLPAAASLGLAPEADAPYRRYLVLSGWNRPEKALAELDLALAAQPDAPILLNTRAALFRHAGALDEARRMFERSLAVDPAQAPVLLELGAMARSRGDRDAARDAFTKAAALGLPDAHVQLAQLASDRRDWSLVRAEIEAWRLTGGSRLLQHQAAELDARAVKHIVAVRAGTGSVAAVALGIPIAWWLRRRTARTLRDLLDGAPESWHEAARLLAGLRHEVLKHNTTVLPDVAAALGHGDRAPWDTFAERAPELLDRFAAYLGALESLGRRHGFRLDLRHRDPILAPMFHAMRRLARARRPPDDIAALSDAINGDGYRALGKIVREICVLPVTSALVTEVYARVVREPGLAGGEPAPLTVTEEPGLAVRMFRAELEDILANLLRNALFAGASRIEVALRQEDDAITGVGWVEVQVRDDAPGTLTNAMIRGRYIGRGLGLAVDIINKHGGSIRVEPADEGFKAVAVQLPSVEAADVEVEWSA